MRYKIGDKVELPLNGSGTPYGFSSDYEGIPEELIVHGNLISTRKPGGKQIGTIVNIHKEYYLVKFRGNHSTDGTGYLQLGFKENQLSLHKKKVLGKKENYLFNIDDL